LVTRQGQSDTGSKMECETQRAQAQVGQPGPLMVIRVPWVVEVGCQVTSGDSEARSNPSPKLCDNDNVSGTAECLSGPGDRDKMIDR
jgi:hypothetical protein